MWDSYILQMRQRAHGLTKTTLSIAGKRGAWRRWKREKAILGLLPMVERVARDVRWMFAPSIDLRDLTQAGTVGLVKAANAFEPALASKAGFDSYAWFRVRGAIIDSQKRRAYREEQNDSLDRVMTDSGAAHGERAKTLLDVMADPSPIADEVVEREQIHAMLQDAIADLPRMERRVLRGQLAGQTLALTASQVGRSVTWTRAMLAQARTMVGVAMRGE